MAFGGRNAISEITKSPAVPRRAGAGPSPSCAATRSSRSSTAVTSSEVVRGIVLHGIQAD
eukprot:13006992-Heterocapsa_arctica.AAC.1